jgi:hypothetical protein
MDEKAMGVEPFATNHLSFPIDSGNALSENAHF